MTEVLLNKAQQKQLADLKAALDAAPTGTSTLAQIIWYTDGDCAVKVQLVKAEPFRRIWDLVTPDVFYRPQEQEVTP